MHLPEYSAFSALLFGAGGVGAAVIGVLACRLQLGRPKRDLAVAALSLAILGGWFTVSGRPAGVGWPLLALAGVLLLFWAARFEHVPRVATALGVRLGAPRWQWTALALGCPLTAGLLALGAASNSNSEDTKPKTVTPPPCSRMPYGTVVTDRGNNVSVWHAEGGPGSEEELRAAEDWILREEKLFRRCIQVAPADRTYNCHGWVFSAGRYLIADEEIPAILRDNGYQEVSQPAAGDLAVYYNDQNVVLHTARVFAVAEGQVVLDSKWSWIGRFLHPPDATPFGGTCKFYHSPRASHLLRGVESRPVDTHPNVPLAQSP